MLTIDHKIRGNAGTMTLTGKIDTTTAIDLDDELRKILPKVDSLTIDCTRLAYVSSAGLRVLLSAKKTLNDKGGLVLTDLTATVKQIFEVTGMTELFTIR